MPKAGVTRVGLVARTTEPVPVSVAKPSISKSQDAAVVPEVKLQTILAVVPATTVPTKLPPDEFTVIVPVLLLIISKAQPKANVLVTGKTKVCVVVPVKFCCVVLVLVRVVVPAAVAVVDQPLKFVRAAGAVVAFVPPFATATVPVTFVAFPLKLAVMVLATKLPPASLATIVDAPLAEAAVVLALATVPVVTFEPLIALIAEPLAVIILAVNEPLASLETIVLAPLASEAVVLALATVPVDTFDPLRAVSAEPLPDTEVNEPLVAVTTLAANEPLASLATIVLAPLAEAAVVLALSKVPEVTLDALIAVSEDPFPEILVKVPVVPVTTFPAKEPLASLRTKVEAPLADAPVVRALSIVPVETLEALIALMAAPLPVNESPVIAPAANSPDVPRSTIVEAPLAVAAVVRALAIVPLDMLEALILVRLAPFPEIVVAVITFAVKEPLASRDTMVDAPLASDAVVLAFAIVPLDMFEALIAVNATPLPDTEVNVPVVPVITLPAKDPLASRTTRVEAPLAEVALVLALSKVPVVIAVALIAVRAEPLPENDVPVIAPAANSPEAPRRTIVEAPLLEEAVVLAFAIVPEAMLEALIAVKATPLPEIEVNVPELAIKLPLASR